MLLASLPVFAAAQATILELPPAGNDTDLSRLARLGDIDGDGHADFILGLPNANSWTFGVVQVRSGADGSVLREWTGTTSGGNFGFAVASVDDADGDGLRDVLVGEPGNQYFPMEGAVRLFSSVTGLGIEGQIGAQFDCLGEWVTGVGDLDGDGRGDFAASAPYEQMSPGIYLPGYVKVISSAGGTLAKLSGSFHGQQFGRGLSSAGDMNADGVPDLAVLLRTSGASEVLGLRVYSGAWIAHGTEPAVLVELPGISARASVADAGDVDGDGFDDLVLGTPDKGTPPSSGGFFVLSGRNHSTLLQFDGSTPGQGLGLNVAGAGDLNGDGTPDLLASGGYSFPQEGQAVAVSGRDGALLGSVVGTPTIMGGYFGSGLAGVGDVNADGTVDWGLSSTYAFHLSLYSQVGLWTDLGNGLAGTNGIPALSGSGTLLGGTAASVQLLGALPSSAATLVIGAFPVNLPFKGGVFVPDATILLQDLLTDGLGGLTVTGTLPPGAPPSEFWFQVWQVDAGGPRGYAASNALRAQVP